MRAVTKKSDRHPARRRVGKARPGVGQRIIAGLKELSDALDSGRPLGEFYTIRSVTLDLEPGQYPPEAVRRVREGLHTSQAIFAEILGVSVHAVQAWEQGKQSPPKMARRLLDEIAVNPRRWTRLLENAYRVRKGA